jgi:hypothetical protein
MRPELRRTCFLALLFAALGLAAVQPSPVRAAPAAPPARFLTVSGGGPSWDSLAPEERRLLLRHRKDWASYPPETRQRMLNGVHRYLQLTPEQQKLVRERADKFRSMSPDEKRRLCQKFASERGRIPPFCRQFLGQ